MTTLRPQPPGTPTGRPTAVSAPYWEGCRAHELRYQQCSACAAINITPARACAACGGPELAWRRSEGRGRLYSWTVVWRPQQPVFEVPYAPAIVALDEGFWLLSAVVGCEPEELCVDLPLVVEFHPADDEITLPYFRPAG